MFAVLVASFVIVVCVSVIAFIAVALHNMRASLDRQIAEDIEAGVFDIPITWQRRMDVPRKRPLLHTRNTKVW